MVKYPSFLHAHRLEGDRQFSVAGKYSPGSIRDQMIRASAIVRAAVGMGLIDEKSQNLLVIGAGAAGVSAAIEAAYSIGISTF